jgi:GH15 family glucan-1,4-alpha-glucosidase
MKDYLPIAEHGVVGDLHTVALVGSNGTIDWFCCPTFDSPSVFGAILDRERGGHFSIEPTDEGATSKQLYLPDTAVLITRFLSEDGVGEIEDFMPPRQDNGARHCQRLVRQVNVVRGTVRFRVSIEPRFNYARATHAVEVDEQGARFRSPELDLALHTEVPLTPTARGVEAEFELDEGESVAFVLEHVPPGSAPMGCSTDEIQVLYEHTIAYWRRWLAQSRYNGRWREMVNRSALTLKLLTYDPTGAIVAAPTASLPEQLGGGRNWDYRYTWIRDSAFSLSALLRLGFTGEALGFYQWLGRIWEETKDEGPGALKLMYGIDGRPDLPETELHHFEGYRGSAPVRIGNDAADQLQLDVSGDFIVSVYIHEQNSLKNGGPLMPWDGWEGITAVIDWICENWDQPDEGIWEVRGGRQPFTYSRLMCWVAIDRALRIAERRAFPADLERWRATRDEIYRCIMERCWNEDLQAFVQYEGSDVLDASLLLMPLVHFIAPTDPRWLSTLEAMGQKLVSDSLVYRYNPEASPDGLEGDEGTFSMCSFWYVECLAKAGRLDEARLAFEKMLTYSNHVGLYSEELASNGELLGNFPQAFTHLALINAAITLDKALNRPSHPNLARLPVRPTPRRATLAATSR